MYSLLLNKGTDGLGLGVYSLLLNKGTDGFSDKPTNLALKFKVHGKIKSQDNNEY